MDYALTSLAFSAGIISFLNPCGFALLPVYIAYYFKNEGLENQYLLKRLFYGLLFALTMSAGLAFVFLFFGFSMQFVGKNILKHVKWIDLIIGALLILTGLLYLLKPSMQFTLTNIGEKIKSNKMKNKYVSFFLYGCGFAIASMGCTLPIFLVVTAAALKSGISNALLTFLVYSLAMALFMIVFTLAVAISKRFIENAFRKYLPYIYKIGSLIIIASGLYLIYNQISLF